MEQGNDLLENWVEYPAAAFKACSDAKISRKALEDGVVAEMVEALDFYANGNTMDRMQDGGVRSRKVFAKLGIKD